MKLASITRISVLSGLACLILTGCHSHNQEIAPHQQVSPIARYVLGRDIKNDYVKLGGVGPYGSPWGYDVQLWMTPAIAPHLQWQIRSLSQTWQERQSLLRLLRDPVSRQSFITGMLLSEENPWLDRVSLESRGDLCLNQEALYQQVLRFAIHTRQPDSSHTGQWLFTVLESPVKDSTEDKVRTYRSLWLFLKVSPDPKAASLTKPASQEFEKILKWVKSPEASSQPGVPSEIEKQIFSSPCPQTNQDHTNARTD